MKKVIAIKYNGCEWCINNVPLSDSIDTEFIGWKVYSGRTHALCFKYEKDNESVNARIFTNGRLSLKYKKDDKVMDSQKRFIPLPINGNLILVTNDKITDSYAYFRNNKEEHTCEK